MLGKEGLGASVDSPDYMDHVSIAHTHAYIAEVEPFGYKNFVGIMASARDIPHAHPAGFVIAWHDKQRASGLNPIRDPYVLGVAFGVGLLKETLEDTGQLMPLLEALDPEGSDIDEIQVKRRLAGEYLNASKNKPSDLRHGDILLSEFTHHPVLQEALNVLIELARKHVPLQTMNGGEGEIMRGFIDYFNVFSLAASKEAVRRDFLRAKIGRQAMRDILGSRNGGSKAPDAA